ncbi:hypothetical protein Tco_0888146 [Tanacetum coccineum]
MNITQAQQKALDDALVAPADRLEFRKCNMRLKTEIKYKEATFQVVLDALALTPFYQAFLITVEDLTNQAMLISKAYKTYYAFASREKTPKPKYVQNKANSDTSPKQKPVQATKGTRLKTKAKVAKSDKKKQPANMTKAKGLDVLSKVALTESEQLKLATKRSKKDFHISHANGLGDGTDLESGVLDEQQRKTSGTNEGTGIKPRVPDVPKYDSESDKESWGDSGEEEEDDDDEEDTDDDNDDDEHNEEEEEYDDEFNVEEDEKMDEEEDDEVTKELYKYSGFKQEEEDAHVTLTPVLDTQKTRDVNEIASLMDIATIPPPPPFFNPLQQQATPTPTPITLEPTTLIPALPDLILPKAVSDFATPVIERNITESLEAVVLAKSSSQPQSTYKAAASLTEFELTKILIYKINESKSHLRVDYKKELYDALVKSYNNDKDLFDTYSKAFSLKRGQDDEDKDQDPSARSDRGTKRRKSSKEAE